MRDCSQLDLVQLISATLLFITNVLCVCVWAKKEASFLLYVFEYPVDTIDI